MNVLKYYPWVKGIQVCSNEGPCPFPGEDNWGIERQNLQLLKIFLSRTTVPISTTHGTRHPLLMGYNSKIVKVH